MIESPVPTRRALLVWQRPLEMPGPRDRCPVAELVQREGGVSFAYLGDDSLSVAREAGFSGYPGLPLGSEGLDRIAMDILMRRLPPRERPDFPDFLERYGLPAQNTYTDLSLLAYTGARLTSDSFSISETFDGFARPFRYVFDVAGNRHYLEAYRDLIVGEPLFFEHEPENPVDPNAVKIVRTDRTCVGYVNRLQAEVVGNWLNSGRIVASVYRVNGRADYPRLFVIADSLPADNALAA